ncbi:MAG: hypothetical protein GXO91_06660 [FCB group bacterium]|nr:hypothetical protein [FCB group bacterium]
MFLLIALFLLSCNSSSAVKADFPPLNFNVQSELLSAPVTIDNLLSLQFPAECNEITDVQRDNIQTVIETDSAAFFQLKLKTIMKSPDGIFILINRISGATDPFLKLDENFENFLQDSFRSDQITRGQFSVNNVQVVQYLITTPGTVAFKLFCKVLDNYYQIDYFIPRTLYEKKLESIESSIGTINTNQTKRR